mmetsp:Transcript_16099/g.24158  ORF Transcript_16099/g.24158 Transcript_16099/m.24158 type:complete len:572 (+) Transcript_16099:211-1926(+)|eukprot:CAMPEP_0203684126 /NCGR_PEP_ID=MMETSP0090-20130426/47874_1 /ASSEMBLY_ACC=CAM_ASM_001088 /TAXON_ID=426623 /ORGANISM="Chaetoceros affinis, Strain CCMP159" /LENGTH=571 /DNA_ID=CAMNT_0050553289 /DNA_START=161 /DNA_END=1879 /DNA_ORIENTATION=-
MKLSTSMALPIIGRLIVTSHTASKVCAFVSIGSSRPLSRGMSNTIVSTYNGGETLVAKRLCNIGSRQQPRLHLNENNDSNKGIDTSIDDDGRRSLLRSIIASSSAIAGIIVGNPLNARAEEEDLLEIDQKKVVMQVDARNIPQKYGTTQQLSSPSPGPSYDDEGWMTQMERRRIDIFEKAAPSVVFIDTYVESRDAFSTNVMEVPIGTGSGFVWDERGHIVTNYHVVRNAKSAQIAILSRKFDDDDESNIDRDFDEEGNEIKDKVATSKQQRVAASPTTPLSQAPIRSTSMRNDAGVTNYARKVYKAKVVGVDPGKDIAVLKIDAPVFDLFPIDVGTSTGLKVGQSAYAIGNPFGLDHTLTVGVISGIGREVKSPIGRPITNVIQTDAAINPGNSGGPLLSSSGKLIGMNTSIYSPSGASAGIGFAIPIDSVKFIVDTLIRDGKIVRPVLGISFLESKQARALGIEKGVLVLDVPTNSNAYKAGLRGTKRTESGLIDIGDIIIKVENLKINTEADLFAALESFKPGDVVRVTVNRVELDASSPTAKLIQKTIPIQLKASSEISISRFLYSQ